MRSFINIDEAIKRLENGEVVYALEGNRVLIHTSYNHWYHTGQSSNKHFIEVSENEMICNLAQRLEHSENQRKMLADEVVKLQEEINDLKHEIDGTWQPKDLTIQLLTQQLEEQKEFVELGEAFKFVIEDNEYYQKLGEFYTLDEFKDWYRQQKEGK